MANEVAFSDRQDRTVMETRVYAPHIEPWIPGNSRSPKRSWKNNPRLDAWTEKALRRFFEDRVWERDDFDWIKPPIEFHSYRYKEVRGKLWTGYTNVSVGIDSDMASKISIFAKAHGISAPTVLHNAMHYEGWCEEYIGGHRLREGVEEERPYYYYDHKNSHYSIVKCAFEDAMEYNAKKIQRKVKDGKLPDYMVDLVEHINDPNNHHQQDLDGYLDIFRENFEKRENAVLAFEDRDYRTFLPNRMRTAEDRAKFSSKRSVDIPSDVRKAISLGAKMRGLDMNEFMVEVVKDFVVKINQKNKNKSMFDNEPRGSGKILKIEIGEKFVLNTHKGGPRDDRRSGMQEVYDKSSVEIDFYKNGKTLLEMERFAEDFCYKSISPYDIIQSALIYEYMRILEYFSEDKNKNEYKFQKYQYKSFDFTDSMDKYYIKKSVYIAECFSQKERIIDWTPLDDIPTNPIPNPYRWDEEGKSFIANVVAVMAIEERRAHNMKIAAEFDLGNAPEQDLDLDRGSDDIADPPVVERRGIVAGLTGKNGIGSQVNTPVVRQTAAHGGKDGFIYSAPPLRPQSGDHISNGPVENDIRPAQESAPEGQGDNRSVQTDETVRAALLGMAWHDDAAAPTP